jgi:hypothetical protein
MRLDQKRASPSICRHWSSRFFKALVMRDDVHDRTELIEPWICLGLTLSVFVLALWLLPL